MSRTVRPPLGLVRSPLGTLAGRSARGKRSKHRGSSLLYRTALDGAELTIALAGTFSTYINVRTRASAGSK